MILYGVPDEHSPLRFDVCAVALQFYFGPSISFYVLIPPFWKKMLALCYSILKVFH